MKHHILLTSLLLSAQAVASAATPTDDAADKVAALRQRMQHWTLPPLSAPFFDADSEGRVWVRGANYKASFDASGATYYPIFGSETPRHFPLKMSLASTTSGESPIALTAGESAVRDGNRVTIHRGAIDEVYEPSLTGLEQSFVIAKRPAGDLKLFVQLDTELSAVATDDGFVFENEFGKVRYGRAFMRDGDGAQHAVESHLVDGGIEIDISADELATAQYPLVVDPFVGQFGVTSTTLAQRLSDITYDAGNGLFLLAFEEVVNAVDGDIRTITIDSTGNNLIANVYVDTTTQDWREPAVGNLNSGNRFLVAASVGNYPPYNVPGLQYRMVVARGCLAVTPLVFSPPILVLSTEVGLHDRYGVSIGGDNAATGTTSFLVAWSEAIPAGATIMCRRVSSAFAPIGTVAFVSSGPGDVNPCVSKFNGHSRWSIVWERGADIYGAQVAWDTGLVVTSEFAIANSSLDEFDPQASSPFADGSWAAVWQQDTAGGERDLYCKVFSGSTLVTERNLSADYPSTQTQDQRMPAIDCDGERIAVVYAENKASSPTDYDIYVSSYFVSEGLLRPSEIHAPITTSSTSTSDPVIVSTKAAGASGLRFGISYTLMASPNSDIFGALYDLPEGGTITSFCTQDVGAHNCPCGNNGIAGHGCGNHLNSQGALLAGSGIASISHDTVLLSGSGMTNSSVLYFQGNNEPGTGVTFGDGVRCTVGAIVRLGIKTNVSGASSFPSGGDPKLSVKGQVTAPTTHTYQAWYRDPAASFCTTATFNLTNALFIVWAE